MTNAHQNWTVFLADISLLEGSMGTDIRETLTLLTCAECSTFLCIFRQFLALFGTFSPPDSFFASGADGEVGCHSQDHLKSCECSHNAFVAVAQNLDILLIVFMHGFEIILHSFF